MHFGLTEYFLVRSEYELNKSYTDLYLEPDLARFSDMTYGYVIEPKYLQRNETEDQAGQVVAALIEAQRQLRGVSGRRNVAEPPSDGAACRSGGGVSGVGYGGLRSGHGGVLNTGT